MLSISLQAKALLYLVSIPVGTPWVITPWPAWFVGLINILVKQQFLLAGRNSVTLLGVLCQHIKGPKYFPGVLKVHSWDSAPVGTGVALGAGGAVACTVLASEPSSSPWSCWDLRKGFGRCRIKESLWPQFLIPHGFSAGYSPQTNGQTTHTKLLGSWLYYWHGDPGKLSCTLTSETQVPQDLQQRISLFFSLPLSLGQKPKS